MAEEVNTDQLRTIAEAALDVQHATPWWTCAYLNRGVEGYDPQGTCSFGCVDEPTCQTCGPWSEEDQDAYYEAHNQWDDAPEEVLTALDEIDRLRAALMRIEEHSHEDQPLAYRLDNIRAEIARTRPTEGTY